MTVTRGCLSRIRSNYHLFSPAEQRVADYVLANPEASFYASGQCLSSLSGVSEATVVRFWRQAGFARFLDFKLALSVDIVRGEAESEKNTDESCLEHIVLAICDTISDGITRLSREIDYGALQKAIEVLARAQIVAFYGVGGSGCAAEYARYRFQRLGRFGECLRDSHMQAISASQLTSKDVAMGLSVSGNTTDVVKALELASGSGATTIAITGYSGSPITEVADIVLIDTVSKPPLGSGAHRSQATQIAFVDMLAYGVTLIDHEMALDNIERSVKAIVDKMG